MDSSTTHSYEGLIHLSCCLCRKDNKQTDARVYCKECLCYLCEQCESQHDRFPAMKQHPRDELGADMSNPHNDGTPDRSDQTRRKVIDGSDMEDEDVGVERLGVLEKCRQHPECYINMFCEDHTSSCCARCAFELHKECKLVIPDLQKESRDIMKSSSYQDNIDIMRGHLEQLESIKDKHCEEIGKSKAERANVEQEIEDFYDEIIGELKRLKAATIAEMNEKFTTQQKRLTSKLSSITHIADTVDRYLKQLDELNTDEVKCYIKYRKGKEIADNLTHVMQGSSLVVNLNSITFKKDDFLTKFANDSSKLGEIQTNNPQPLAATSNPTKKAKPISSPYKYPWLPVGGVFH